MKRQKRVKAAKRRRPYFKGRLLMRLHNLHDGTIFSGVRQGEGRKKRKDYSDYRGEIRGSRSQQVPHKWRTHGPLGGRC